MLKDERDPISSIYSHSTETNVRFTGMKNRKMIKSASLNVPFYEDVTSHVLSFKCLFCDAYIFTLRSFIIHLKSSHSNENISQVLNDQFRSCITSVEKEKVVIVTYAFPREDVDFCWNISDDASSNSDTSLCSPKSINCYRDLEYEKQKAPSGNPASAIASRAVSIENDCHSKYYLNTLNNGNVGQKDNNDSSNLQNDAQLMKNLSQRISDISTNQTSLDDIKDCTSNNVPILLAESTRRRQLSAFEKMMALTCQKCGQKFKNRCMLTRHAIEHKRANNPYRCTIDGCLDSYAEKRKLIAHLNYKHTELSKKEREVMVMKGDELLKKLRDMLVITFTTTASNDQPVSFTTTDIISTNHILKNMIENVECEKNDESLLKTIKSANFDNFDIMPPPPSAPPITNSTGVIFFKFYFA
ncbi:unnamed protein product [Acanthocheilonema viteae]|uniref:C2H2-type domain-containing protein n=1 Tax=Acanthocheilonema viteae TaxID=6277 RepID=A0A498SBB0_ACAVI|nr:unnamed protein product [Acanthocheilonema viteae]